MGILDEYFEEVEDEDFCDFCRYHGKLYTRTSSETGEAEAYWCPTCAVKHYEEEQKEAEAFNYWIAHHICPECGSEDLTDLGFDVKECCKCGKQFKPSIEMERVRRENE